MLDLLRNGVASDNHLGGASSHADGALHANDAPPASTTSSPTHADSDVLVFPAFQQEAVNLTTDYALFKECLDIASRLNDVDLYLTSGYVNFPKEIAEKLAHYRSTMRFLFAAPQANSFFHDPGFASVIPACYNIVGLRSERDE